MLWWFKPLLTADVVARACVRVPFSATEIELEAVALVRDKVGVAVGYLTFGELSK